jgi:anthranilate phosphoribosyltransferase
VLAGEPGAAQDVLTLNAGAALYVGGKAQSLHGGVAKARELIEAGHALLNLERLAEASHAGGQ